MLRPLIFVLILLMTSVANAEKHIIFFSATWCPPCRAMKPNWDSPKVLKATEGIRVHKIDIDEYPRYTRDYNVGTIPQTLIVDYDGKETKVLKRHIGLLSPDGIIQMIGE